jgi:hypothetical protein
MVVAVIGFAQFRGVERMACIGCGDDRSRHLAKQQSWLIDAHHGSLCRAKQADVGRITRTYVLP